MVDFSKPIEYANDNRPLRTVLDRLEILRDGIELMGFRIKELRDDR